MHVVSAYKAITWRVIATVFTFITSLIVTGDVVISTSIMGIDSVIKIVLYYYHERIWSIYEQKKK